MNIEYQFVETLISDPVLQIKFQLQILKPLNFLKMIIKILSSFYLSVNLKL